MGYYTYYQLTILVDDDNNGVNRDLEIIANFRENYESAEYALQYDGSSADSCKWYNSNEELIEFSLKYPLVLFLLEGEGEESGDLWRLYVKNGKSRRVEAEIVYPEFCEDMLK